MIGLVSGSVVVAEYSDEWPRIFAAERERIDAAIGAFVLDVQHIGSTSVPGLAAKPIVDIGIAVADFDDARVCIEPMVRLGYEFRGEFGIPRRHYFVLGAPCRFHVHMVEVASDDWRKTVAFRDWLRAHPDDARAYADLKLDLARRHPDDRPAYQDGKSAFIERITQMAYDCRSPRTDGAACSAADV